MILVAFAPAWSMTAVWIVVPAIAAEWQLGPGQVHWVASGFIASMLPAMGATPWLLRRIGVRSTALGALALLAGGGLWGATGTSYEALVVARLLEGLAAGVLQPLPVLVVARSFAAEVRGRAMGLFTLGLTLAPALAPAVAGALAEHLGWRSVLLSAAPLVLLAATVVGRALPAGAPVRPSESTENSAAASSLVGLFGHARFRLACFVAFSYGLTTFAAGYLVPVFLQVGLGHGATLAGLALLPSGLALALASPFGGRLADRWPRHRVIAVGMVVFSAAHLLLLAPAAWIGWYAACLVASRLGMALALPSLALDALRGLPVADWAAASSMVSLARQLGAALGIAAASGFIAARLGLGTALQQAFHECFVLVAAVCALGAWTSWNNGPVRQD